MNNQSTNNVLLVKIEGSVWYTIYHNLPVVKGVQHTPLLINQPLGIWDIYGMGDGNYLTHDGSVC